MGKGRGVTGPISLLFAFCFLLSRVEEAMTSVKVLSILLLAVTLAGCVGTVPPTGTSPGNQGPGRKFIIEEKLVRTEGPFQLWRVLYWSRDKNGRPVKTTAKVYRPTDTSVKRPGLIWNHGGWNQCTSLRQLFKYAELGYVVIGADYQGCDGLGEPDYLGTEINDVLGTLDWLKSHPEFVDVTKIYMVGHSLGGAITLRTLDTLPDLGRVREIKAAVVQATVYSENRAYKEEKNQEIRTELMEKYHLSDQEVQALKRSRSPDMPQNHDKVAVPIFIAHGTADTYVPPDHSKLLAADLAKMGVKHKLKLYPGARHTFDEPQLSEYLRDCQIWFQENSR